MRTSRLLALAGAVLSLAMTSAVSAEAQVSRRERDRAEAPSQTPEQAMAAGQALATATNSPCQVTAATKLGTSPDGGDVYEVTCATGPGYVLTGSTPPSAIDCVMLEYTLNRQAAQAAAAPAPAAQPRRGRNTPAPEVKHQACVMPANTDTLAVMKGYATQAGVACTIDQAEVIGGNSSGAIVYEIGCANADGYRINRKADGAWEKLACQEVVSAGGTCKFTTAAEQLAGFKGWIAGSDAASCDPTQYKFMGANANGSFYEAKCAAGNGLIVRLNDQMQVQQVYPCETAQRIGGGCTLTIVPAPAPAAAAPPAQR